MQITLTILGGGFLLAVLGILIMGYREAKQIERDNQRWNG